MHRNSTIHITEYGTQTAITVQANEKIEFQLTIVPKTFADPRIAELEKVVESQREEITTVLGLNSNLTAELADAKKAVRNGKRTPQRSRR